MKNNNQSFNYHEFRTKNNKTLKQKKSYDLKEIDQLSKKLDAFTFHKKLIKHHLKPDNKNNCHVIQEEEDEDLLCSNEISTEKLHALKRKAKHNHFQENSSTFEIPLDALQKRDLLEQSFDECFSNKRKVGMIQTERVSIDRQQDISDRLSLSVLHKSTLLSTSNSINGFHGQKILDKSSLLMQVREIYSKIQKRIVPPEEVPEIMGLLQKINYIIDNY